jgi:malonyl-CoA O-methyltransferase
LLRRHNPEAELVALDLDAALIGQARKRLAPDAGVSWLVADGEAFSRGCFDLIISNATFQWFTQPRETLQAYSRVLGPGGSLAFSTLGPETFLELAASLRQAAAALGVPEVAEIPARGFSTLENWENFLNLAGFSRVQSARQMLETHFPAVPDFLQALKATGATNPRPRAFTPRLLNTLIRAYDSRFRQNGSIPVTYEVIWVLARK